MLNFLKRMILFFLSFIILSFIYISNVNKTKAEEINNNNKEHIIDNANIIDDESIVMAAINNLQSEQNIETYIYTIQKATQENFEKTMQEYSSSIQNDFILFYLSKDNANVGIYVSDNLKYVITDANKSLMLKTMESFITLDYYDKAIVASISNLNEILKVNNTEIEHKTLEIEDKSIQRKNSIIGMAIASIIFIFFSIVFIRITIKDKKEEQKNENL